MNRAHPRINPEPWNLISIISIMPWIILAQNDDGPLKWATGPYPIQIHANFQILMGHLKFLWALSKI